MQSGFGLSLGAGVIIRLACDMHFVNYKIGILNLSNKIWHFLIWKTTNNDNIGTAHDR